MVKQPARTPVRLLLGAALVAILAACESPAALPPADWSPRPDAPRLLGESGNTPENLSVFDVRIPAVTKLEPDLLAALRRAAEDAADRGITFSVNSGWRSAEYQQRMLRDAVAEYGSEAEAARWVATPETSPHVSGDAVDLGPAAATTWLAEHGARYGLCRIYDNEPWHFELRPGAVHDGCPPRYADPTHDPRMK